MGADIRTPTANIATAIAGTDDVTATTSSGRHARPHIEFMIVRERRGIGNAPVTSEATALPTP